MNIFDVVVNTDDLVVLGPPNNIDLSIDFGPQGQRGTKWFVGSGNPNAAGVITSSTTVIEGDIFVNTATTDGNAWLYIAGPSGSSWEEALRLQPSLYSNRISSLAFSSGIATVSITLTDIVAVPTGISLSQYVVTVTPEYGDPCIVSLSDVSFDNPSAPTTLDIDLKAMTYSGAPTPSWSLFTGNLALHLKVSVI